MHAFQYHRPSSTKDALSLAQQKGEGRYLAGGQSLVQAMKLRLTSPSDLIDLGTIKELSGRVPNHYRHLASTIYRRPPL